MYHVSDMSFGSEGCLIARTTDVKIFTGLKNAKEYEIMQYTGLKDKNGKMIFEGDIVKFTNEVDEIFNVEIGVVVFEQTECNFCIQRTVINPKNYPVPKTTRTIYLIDNTQYEATYEIIGNIFSNPELLQEVTHEK